MTINVYPYHPETGEYLGLPFPAQICSFEKTVIRTAYSSVKEPPVVAENEVAVLRNEDGSVPIDADSLDWRVLPDYRGTTYWLPDGTSNKITAIGEVPVEGCSLEAPGPTEAEIKLKRIGELQSALLGLDQKKIRAISSALLNSDLTFLQALEAQQEELRVELRTLL